MADEARLYVEQRRQVDNGDANVTLVERYVPAGPDDLSVVMLLDHATGEYRRMRLVASWEEYGKR